MSLKEKGFAPLLILVGLGTLVVAAVIVLLVVAPKKSAPTANKTIAESPKPSLPALANFPQIQLSPNPSPSASSSGILTNFESPDKSYSFQYPSSGNTTCCNIGGSGTPDIIVAFADRDLNTGLGSGYLGGLMLGVFRDKLSSGQDFNSYVKAKEKQLQAGTDAQGQESATKVANKNAVSLIGFSPYPTSDILLEYPPGQVMDLIYLIDNKEKPDYYKSLLAQILSTFKFNQ